METQELNVILDRIEILARRRAPSPEPTVAAGTGPVAATASPPVTAAASPPVMGQALALLDFVKKARTLRDQNAELNGEVIFAFGAMSHENITHAELRAALAVLETMGYA
jgi:hypothetical protein